MLSCPVKVALLSTLIFAPGHHLFLSAMVSSMMPGKSGWPVGSPFPAKVSTSGCVPLSCIITSCFSSACATSCLEGCGECVRRSLLKPHSQYRQSKVHIFPSAGIRLMPKLKPSRRLCTGP